MLLLQLCGKLRIRLDLFTGCDDCHHDDGNEQIDLEVHQMRRCFWIRIAAMVLPMRTNAKRMSSALMTLMISSSVGIVLFLFSVYGLPASPLS